MFIHKGKSIKHSTLIAKAISNGVVNGKIVKKNMSIPFTLTINNNTMAMTTNHRNLKAIVHNDKDDYKYEIHHTYCIDGETVTLKKEFTAIVNKYIFHAHYGKSLADL